MAPQIFNNCHPYCVRGTFSNHYFKVPTINRTPVLYEYFLLTNSIQQPLPPNLSVPFLLLSFCFFSMSITAELGSILSVSFHTFTSSCELPFPSQSSFNGCFSISITASFSLCPPWFSPVFFPPSSFHFFPPYALIPIFH